MNVSNQVTASSYLIKLKMPSSSEFLGYNNSASLTSEHNNNNDNNGIVAYATDLFDEPS